MTHYELFFFFAAGFTPKDVVRVYQYSGATAYRAYRNYRNARKRAKDIIQSGNRVSIKRENKLNDLDV
jgi:hypothetical protein